MKKNWLIIYLFLALFSCSKKESPAPAPVLSNDKAIMNFSFLKKDNPSLEADVAATITDSKITVELPGNITERNLIASFSISPKAKLRVGSTEQSSSITKNDFTNTVTYEVEAENKSKANYTVEIKKLGSSPLSTINNTSSQAFQNANFNWGFLQDITWQNNTAYYQSDRFAARTFYDFDKDGDQDLMTAEINFGQAGANVPIDISYFKNTNGTYQKDNSVFNGAVPQYVHARQAILGDYDKNGWMDVVIIGHGWDQDPFPGEKQKIMLNNNGTFTTKELPVPLVQNNSRLPFTHSGCSADIDNDGDLDLFYTNNMGVAGITLLNDGAANFSYSSTVFPNLFGPYFSSNLQDLNNDGYVDLVITGHDQDANVTAQYGAKPTIFWGSYDGKYSLNRVTYLPVVAKFGVSNAIQFIDYNKDGRIDLLIAKTGDGATGSNPFYKGWYLQLLQNDGGNNFSDVSSKIQNNNNTNDSWVVWYLVKDIDSDGDMDIVSDDKWYNHQWRNDNGNFVKF